jgi:TRAP-type C4-dicarboxylate transport system permease small subunit
MPLSVAEKRRFLDYWIDFLTRVSAVASFVAMIFISLVVGARFLFNFTIPGMLDVTEMILVLIIFFPLSYVEKNGEHLQMEILFSKFPSKMKSTLKIIWKILTAILFAVLAAISLGGTLTSYYEHESSWGDLALPLWIPKLFIFLGCVSVFLLELVYLLCSRIPRNGEKSKI